MTNDNLALQQLKQIQSQISLAAEKSGRDSQSITLLGASKQQAVDIIRQFHMAGLTHFGENYLQEALAKQAQLLDLAITWHFIGGIQSNKCKDIAHHFSWAHGVDRFKIAQRLDRFREVQHDEQGEAHKAPLNVLIQLNVDQEQSKNGVSPEQALVLSEQITSLPNLKLRGLMVIPKASLDKQQQRLPFKLAHETLTMINEKLNLTMDTLSMGMSNDLDAAIAEGSTLVRIGTALFGARGQ